MVRSARLALRSFWVLLSVHASVRSHCFVPHALSSLLLFKLYIVIAQMPLYTSAHNRFYTMKVSILDMDDGSGGGGGGGSAVVKAQVVGASVGRPGALIVRVM